MAILDVGHYATEIISIKIMKDVIGKQLADLNIVALESATDPLRAYSA